MVFLVLILSLLTLPPNVDGSLYQDNNGDVARVWNYGSFYGYTIVDPVSGLPVGGQTFTTDPLNFHATWYNSNDPQVPLIVPSPLPVPTVNPSPATTSVPG